MEENIREKLSDIVYFETTGKKKILQRINESMEEIKEKTNITSISLQEISRGYFIKYTISNAFEHEIFCYTLSEVIIHLRYLRKGV